MIKHIITIFILIIPSVFAQKADTLYADTSFAVRDSLQTVKTDTTFSKDSLSTIQKIQVPDTLVPINVGVLSSKSDIIGRKTFLQTPYRYAGDLLKPFSLSFTTDLGFIGQPHETFIYGVGNGGISYLEDGILWNNRYTNSLDLNLVQSEDIDSIEIVPSPRGFLYGPYNNPVAVNFIMRDFLSPEPYTRIRYYEGPNGEAMIDGKFNAQVAKRWNLSFQVTNRSVDETYKNTDLSIWQANAKLKFFLSNSINITGLYSFVNSSIGLNGGIDIDSVRNITGDVNSVIYDPQLAPVVYPNRIMDVEQHNVGLRTLANPFDDGQLNISLYYRYSLDEIKDQQDTLEIENDFEEKSYGILFSYTQKSNPVTLQINSSYERNNKYHTSKYFNSNYYESFYDYLAFAGVLTYNFLDEKIKPSVFYKHSTLYLDGIEISKSGVGVDIKIEPTENLSFYAGYSEHTNHYSHDNTALEVSGNFNNSDVLIDLRYFDNEYNASLLTQEPPPLNPPSLMVNGLGLKLNYKLWLILLETNTSYYFKNDDNNFTGLPELHFVGGLYLKSKFFDDNLNLKSGFTFHYTGKRNSYNLWWRFVDVEPSNKLDFILIGEIQELAIVYFVWENLFDKQYFITPYYPMPERSIRFGLSWELFN